MRSMLGRAIWTIVLGGLVTEVAAGADSHPHPGGSGQYVLAANEEDLPLSKDDLFGVAPPSGKKATTSAPKTDGVLPTTKENLFDVEPASQDAKGEKGLPLRGFFQTRLAYAYPDTAHWSNVLGRLELGTEGHLGSGIKWKASGRAEYNAVYDLTDYYSDTVRDDQRTRFRIGETYLDFTTGSLDWRVGRQQIVWGEMVGLFFADVVSAKDLSEFILPDFQTIRIPQWAARAEYFRNDFHAELVWIPFPTYDEIGKPFTPGEPGAGSDFFPYPISPAGMPIVMGEKKPGYGLDHTNYGLRLSQLTNGWDLSGFFYSSMDSQPTFYRDAINKQVFYPRHDRIWQAGGTVAKDFGTFVLKGEAVYTDGRRFNVTDLLDSDGLVKQNTLDWVVGLDFDLTAETRLNTQLFQRIYFDHSPNTIFDQYESGVSLLMNHKLRHNWEAEALLIHSLNRADWMVRPKVSWRFQPDWRMDIGLDIFGGPPTGLFGQYDKQDRVYTELRRDF
jgi:hypothetical protein